MLRRGKEAEEVEKNMLKVRIDIPDILFFPALFTNLESIIVLPCKISHQIIITIQVDRGLKIDFKR